MSLALLEQLIEMEIQRDAAWKDLAVKARKGEWAVGDSAMLQHLKNLRVLIEKEYLELELKHLPARELTKMIEFGDVERTCCEGSCGCNQG